MSMRVKSTLFAAALLLGAAGAVAKLPPPPPVDEATKAAADAKKAEAAAKTKAELEASQDAAVKNYQANLRKAGKPVPKPNVIAAAKPAAAPAKAGAPAAPAKK